MSTATLTSLLDYLTRALTTDNKRWLADHLYQQVWEKKMSVPYTMEEINSRLDLAESESAAGLGQDSEEMFRELEDDHIEVADFWNVRREPKKLQEQTCAHW